MSYEVNPDELRTHGSHLDALADRLNTAVDAANTVAIDDSAYGLLCAFLPPIVNATTQDDAVDTLKAAAEGVQITADNIRTAATAYEDQDAANAEPFERQLRDGYQEHQRGGVAQGYGRIGVPQQYGAAEVPKEYHRVEPQEFEAAEVPKEAHRVVAPQEYEAAEIPKEYHRVEEPQPHLRTGITQEYPQLGTVTE